MFTSTLREFFMWCTIINGGILILTCIMSMFAQNFIYSMHKKWFPITKEEFSIAIYSFLGLFKIFFIVFNLVPYIALLIIK
jgi:hypothetical protein